MTMRLLTSLWLIASFCSASWAQSTNQLPVLAEFNGPVPDGMYGNRVLWDLPRAKAYVNHDMEGLLSRYDMAAGVKDGEITFTNLMPLGFCFAPGNGSMYVGLIEAVNSGFIAEIDLDTFTEIRRFPVGLAPFDVAVSPTKLVVSDAYNQWTRVETYDLASGNLLGNESSVIREGSYLAMHPSFQRVYSSGGETTHRLELLPSGVYAHPPDDFNWVMTEDIVWLFPDGARLVNSGGRVYTSDAISTNDLKFITRLEDNFNRHISFDSAHGAFFTIHDNAKNTMSHRNLRNYQLAGRYFLPTKTLSIVAATNELWSLGEKTPTQLAFYRLANPAVGAETNTPPVAHLAFSPAPTTVNEVALDASGSTDDAPGLSARWDFNGDGVFDQDFSTNLIVRTNFNIAGPRTTIVQIRDRFGELSTATNQFNVQRLDDPGLAPATHAAFELPYRASRVAFDTARELMYATDAADKRLRVTDLRTGLEIRQYQFTREPESLAITPDCQWLYVALLSRPHDTQDQSEGNGFVAEFDLQRGVKTQEFTVDIDPGPLVVTDQRIVVVGGGSGQSTHIKTFEATTGISKGAVPFSMLSPLALHPTHNFVYAASLHSAGSGVAVFEVNSETQALIERPELSENLENFRGSFSLSEDGGWILSQRGHLTKLKPSGELEAVVITIDPAETQQAIFARPALKMIVTATPTELRWTHLETQYRAATVPLGNSAVFLGRKHDTIWAVSLPDSSTTRIQTVIDPTVASEGNLPPNIHYTISPTTPTTRHPTTIDASLSTDENTPTTELSFRWDLNSDGAFETSWTNQSTFSNRFLDVGEKKMSLQVRDKWGAVSTNVISFNVVFEADPGEPGFAHEPFRLPYAAADWAFDSIREKVWLSFPINNTLAVVDLQTGLVERQWNLPFLPESLAMSPNGSTLYIAVVVQPHDSFWRTNFGYVAEFDPDTQVMTKVVRYGIDPGDIAVTDRYLFIAGGSGGNTTVNGYDLTNGRLIGQAPAYNGMRLTTAFSQTKIFGATYYSINPYIERFAFDANLGTFGTGVKSQSYVQDNAGLGGGKVFALPGETNVVGGGGGIYLDRLGSPQDLRIITNLNMVPVMGYTAVPGTNQFALVSGPRIAYYTNGTFTPTTYQLGVMGVGLGAAGTNHFVVAVTNGITILERRLLPSVSALANQAPTLRWSAPDNNAVFAAPAYVGLMVETEDVDGGIVSVDFLENGTLIGRSTNFPFVLNYTPAAGSHAIDAIATDNLGATSVVQRIHFRVTTLPNISWIYPADVTVVDAGSDFSLQVNAADSDGSIREVRFYQNSFDEVNYLGSASQTASPYSLSITNISVTTIYLARAIDNDGFSTDSALARVQVAGPPGDEFYRPFMLNGMNIVAEANNADASMQLFEKAIISPGPHKTIWWSWKPPVAGLYSLSTHGSSFDTVLGVYMGTNIAALTAVALNDDDPANVPSSLVKFAAYPSTNYMIVVDGYRGETGQIHLALALEMPIVLAPANDNFANRYVRDATNFVEDATNVGATAENAEPRHASILTGQSIWWEVRTATNGVVSISTEGSAIDTILAVYTATSPTFSGLRALTANDDAFGGGRQSAVSFFSPHATNYYVAVTGFGSSTGAVKLKLSFTPGASNAPVNNHFSARLPLDGSDFQFDWSNVAATAETNEPPHGFGVARTSVWWTWRAPATGAVYVRALGYGITAGVAVYTGDALTKLGRSGTTAPGGKYTFNAIAGVDYAIAVDSSTTNGGIFNLALNMAAPPVISPQLAISLSATGEPELMVGSTAGTAVIYHSSDLELWSPVLTNQVTVGQKIPLPFSTTGQNFYRLELW